VASRAFFNRESSQSQIAVATNGTQTGATSAFFHRTMLRGLRARGFFFSQIRLSEAKEQASAIVFANSNEAKAE